MQKKTLGAGPIPSLHTAMIFEKPLPDGWTLRKYAHEQCGSHPGKGCYWDHHELRPTSGKWIPLPHWEWAEPDEDKLSWAANGCLYQLPLSALPALESAQLLHDFSGYTFEAVTAPY